MAIQMVLFNGPFKRCKPCFECKEIYVTCYEGGEGESDIRQEDDIHFLHNPNIRFRNVLYVQEVVTLQKKYLIYLHQRMRFTPFINYYNTLG